MFFKNFSAKKKVLSVSYTIVLLGLFLYSFTQIDLSLTFSRIDFLRNLVKSFQYIGYFDRPLSTGIYIFFLLLLFGFYSIFLYLSSKNKLDKKYIWKLIITTSLILVFSYNAFSYDIFNYIFDAKIITHYHQLPFEHKALDYPGDPMLSFMRWTHRVYPYGPFWLVLTVPLSYLGFGFFLPTFFMFKLLMASCFLGSIYYIGKIFQKINPHKENFGLVFFGLQPLVVIESLVSGHLDIVMVFFSLLAFYRLIDKKYFSSISWLLFSIGIKFATVLLLPIFGLIFFWKKKRETIPWNIIFVLTTLLVSITVGLASYRTTFQPWYLIVPLSFAVFVGYKYYIMIPNIIISFFAMLTYVPYLFTGNWDPPIPLILTWVYGISYALSIIFIISFRSVYFYRLMRLRN